MEPIDPDVATRQPEVPQADGNSPASSYSDPGSEYLPTSASSTELPTYTPIPLSEQELWHRRLGHLNEKDVLKLHDMAQGMPKLQQLDYGAVKGNNCSRRAGAGKIYSVGNQRSLKHDTGLGN
jgi:hypothetical protein